MPKIIFTSQYIRDAPPAQLENYVKYIGTREGVEKIDESKLLLPATIKQQQLIGQLIRDIPSAKDMLEYADYCENPSIGNATEFISLALEQNLNLIGKRENYVEYIAGRPRVERIGEHGLFTDAGVPVVLAQVVRVFCRIMQKHFNSILFLPVREIPMPITSLPKCTVTVSVRQ